MLILKSDGTIEARPKTFSCSERASKVINMHNPSVAPEPPKIAKALLNYPANGMLAPFEFATIFAKKIGVINAEIMLAP